MTCQERSLLVDAQMAASILAMSLRLLHEKRRADPRFPKPVALGARCLRWRVADLEQYVDGLPVHDEVVEPAHLRLARDARPRRSSAKAP
jgi:predicted DNA-binding transcriptional regulator AlpA